MKKETNIQNIKDKYKSGLRYFINLDFDKGEKLNGVLLENTIFDNCCFSADFSKTDFSNSKFINCNLKCSDFTNCNFTNTTFENCLLECTIFKDAIIQETLFKDCYCYGQKVYFDKTTHEITSNKNPLVEDLYNNIPEFNKIADHFNDELPYIVYGELSLKLFEDIKTNDKTTDFTNMCFKFFNLLGDRKDNIIDNLLVVGIYEGLYANKKCNDIARQLLTGRNKELYEYWMINGNIRADY
jgi:hypothetical protein